MGSSASVTTLSEALQKEDHIAVQQIVNRGKCDINERNSEGQTPLMLACLAGQTKIVSILLKAGAKPNLYLHTRGGGISLHFASIGGYTGIVDMLLKSGATIGSRNNKGLSPLHLACEMDHLETVKLLLSTKGCDMNMKDNDGDTPLMLAIRMNRERTVFQLIQSGADPNIKNKDGWGVLLWACEGGHINIVTMLLRETKADPCIRNNNGTSALHVAANKGYMEIIKLLLETEGVYVDMQDLFLATSLHVAARNGNNSLVTMLLESGADPGIQNRNGATSLIIACQHGHASTAILLLRLAACSIDINAADRDGWTALHYAIASEMIDIVKMIVESTPGFDVNKHTDANETPLILAVKCGNEYLVYFLLMNGADAHVDPGDGRTALFEASERDYTTIARMLMEA